MRKKDNLGIKQKSSIPIWITRSATISFTGSRKAPPAPNPRQANVI